MSAVQQKNKVRSLNNAIIIIISETSYTRARRFTHYARDLYILCKNSLELKTIQFQFVVCIQIEFWSSLSFAVYPRDPSFIQIFHLIIELRKNFM